jgi:hypothetical protein
MIEWMDLENERIAAFQRTYKGETILAVHNLGDSMQKILLPIKKPVTSMTDLLTGRGFTAEQENIEVELMPYQYLWLS